MGFSSMRFIVGKDRFSSGENKLENAGVGFPTGGPRKVAGSR